MCFYIRLSQNKTLTCHPERAKPAKFCVVEACRAEQNRGTPPSGVTTGSINAYNNLPRANELFQIHKRQRKTWVCANILRREIRPSFVGSPFGLRGVAQSLPDRLRSFSAMTAGGMFCGRSSFVGDGLARPVFRACRLRGGVRLFVGGAILAAARSHSRSDITP